MTEFITLAHGSGGKLTHRLISDVFYKYFCNDILAQGDDAAHITIAKGKMAYTTDSYVISPIFFKGGDIGKLSICGTVNDLATSGAKPAFLSCGFIIEEGFPLASLEKIVASMAQTAQDCGVKIVTGDTKVVPRGAADGIFINTSGIGIIPDDVDVSAAYAKPGDLIIITGTIGDHGCSILLQREEMTIASDISSDCAPLNGLVDSILNVSHQIHVLRDPTRGGLATTLNEIASQSQVGIVLHEEQLPVKMEVRGVCEILGLDPLYLANEGKMVIILPSAEANNVLAVLKKHPLGKESRVIGEVMSAPEGKVIMNTITGGNRFIEMLTGDQLPRIC